MRNLVLFVGLAAAAGVAFSAVRRAAPAAAVDLPEGELDADAWGALPVLDAATDAADSLGGLFVTQQHLSAYGLDMLADLEGFSATPYADYKGSSIGYGHLIKPGEDLTYVSVDQARELLAQDVADAERAVRTAVAIGLTESQFDALVLLAYNIGEGAFRRSTLVRKLNAGDVAGAAQEFPRWVRAGGQVNVSLVKRRDRERALFEA